MNLSAMSTNDIINGRREIKHGDQVLESLYLQLSIQIDPNDKSNKNIIIYIIVRWAKKRGAEIRKKKFEVITEERILLIGKDINKT